MKKFIALLCMLTCIFSMTACGSDTEISEYQASKIEMAEQHAVGGVIEMMKQSIANTEMVKSFAANDYTAEEWEYIVQSVYGLTVDGDAFLKAFESFKNGQETMGDIVSTGTVNSIVKDETIIVTVDVGGVLKTGQVEMIFSNDGFLELQSCTLNVDATFGELMTNAALNTLLGMGSVFTVLILIMFIIMSFELISKAQTKSDKKEASAKASAPASVVEAAPAAVEELTDYSLVAVIAAAIAAYEGKTSTDGFVVRSIKKSKRR